MNINDALMIRNARESGDREAVSIARKLTHGGTLNEARRVIATYFNGIPAERKGLR